MRGSYFPNENYDFDSQNDKLPMFVEMLKNRGCYISDDGHIRSKKGNLMSKLARNGYYLCVAQYDKKVYYFMEHRVVWVWYNGAIPKGLVVNHKDYNTANNKIDNLELMTQKENTEYSRCHMNPCRGEKSPKAQFTDKQAAAIKLLGNVCGWSPKQVSELVGCSNISAGRIINGKRYPNVITPTDIMSCYSTVVDFTRNKSIPIEEELKNYIMGLCGEAGEVADIVKKHLYHGKELNQVEIIYELGDVLYYLCAICLVLGIDFDEIMLNNNAKLMARYKEGYSIEQSLNRIEDKI